MRLFKEYDSKELLLAFDEAVAVAFVAFVLFLVVGVFIVVGLALAEQRPIVSIVIVAAVVAVVAGGLHFYSLVS